MFTRIRTATKWRKCYSHPHLTIGISSVILAGFSSTVVCDAHHSYKNNTKENTQLVPLTTGEKGKSRDEWIQYMKHKTLKGKDIFNGLLRFGHAALVVVSIVIDYKISLRKIDSESNEYYDAKSACHQRSAIKLKDLCCANRGVFIKVGQHLGALDFLLPKEYVDTLRVLHNEAPESPFASVRQVAEEELGASLYEVFQHFEEKPLGAASLAQVHRAVLQDGRQVAVKVQHKTVAAHAQIDMATIDFLVNVVAWIFPEFRFEWLVEELRRNIPLELDFVQEGKNCDKVEGMLRKFPYLKVPKVYWDVSAKRLLTMEFCEGGAIDDLDYYNANDIEAKEVSSKLGRLYSEMIFVHGFVHCDPHPGNILVRKSANGKAEIVLLDHGTYQTLTDDFRITYCKLWQSLISGDVNRIKVHSEALGVGEMYGLFACMLAARSWDSINAGIQNVSVSEKEVQEIQKYAAQYIPEITEVLNRVPRQMVLIFKTNDLLRGIDSKLNTKSTSGSFVTMLRCCVQAIKEAELRQCNSLRCRIGVHLQAYIDNLRITAYQFSLTPCGQRILWWLTALNNTWIRLLRSIKNLVRWK